MLYSIKTHGIGVMGTVINTFYKFLVKKLNIFQMCQNNSEESVNAVMHTDLVNAAAIHKI